VVGSNGATVDSAGGSLLSTHFHSRASGSRVGRRSPLRQVATPLEIARDLCERQDRIIAVLSQRIAERDELISAFREYQRAAVGALRCLAVATERVLDEAENVPPDLRRITEILLLELATKALLPEEQ
jgi:hypothetical protein